VLTAEGEKQAAILRAEGEAQAISTVFGAIHDGKPDPQLLSYQYLQMLPELARGDANKVFVIPSEFAEAFGGITKAFAGGQATETAGGTAAEPARTDPGANSRGTLPSGQ
jgi:regulator of protease activity HflC (stomatin/prohibitin superfamily)